MILGVVKSIAYIDIKSENGIGGHRGTFGSVR